LEMTQEKRGRGDVGVQDALDLCLLRIAEGEAPDRCLADFPELAAELRPLLDAAVVIQQDLGAPAPPPAGSLVGGRTRLLAAAEAARLAHSPALASEAAAAEALDRVLAAVLNTRDEAARNGKQGFSGADQGRVPTTGPAELTEAELSGSDSLTPLLATARAVQQSLRPSPPAPGGMAAGRERMLAIAAAVAAAEAPLADVQPDQAESLDRALAAASVTASAGFRRTSAADAASPRAAGAEASSTAEPHAALIGLVDRIRTETAAAPPAPQSLLPGRARFLEIAARTAKHRGMVASDQTIPRVAMHPALSWLRGRLTFGSAQAGLLRLTAASLAAVLLFFGGVRALETEAAASLPGDALYTIKRINESMDLMLHVFDTDASVRLRNEQAKLRATEIEQAIALGRLVESKVVGGLMGFGRTSADPEAPRGKVSVRVPAEGDDAEVHSYGWDAETRMSPGNWGKMSAVPRGSKVELRIVSERTVDGYARAISLKVLDQPAQPMTATATLTVTATITPTGGAAVPVTPTTATPTARPSASPTSASPTPLPSPTPTLAPSATATAAETVDDKEPPRAASALSRYSGWVVAQPRPNLWRIEEDLSQAVNDFDLSLLSDDDRTGIVIGDAVRVVYRKGTNPRLVESIALVGKGRCVEGLQMGGTVASLENGRLRLNSGADFILPESIQGRVKLQPGMEVEIRYRDCGGRLELIDVTVLSAEPNIVSVEGLIDRIDELGEGRLSLHLDTGEQIDVGPETEIRPGGSTLSPGQFIMVEGEQRENGLILAHRIDILDGGDAAAPPGGGDEPPARATAGPAPTAVPSPNSPPAD
jgi:hypothetical protein